MDDKSGKEKTMKNIAINTFGYIYSGQYEQALDRKQSLYLMCSYKMDKSRLKCLDIDFACRVS